MNESDLRVVKTIHLIDQTLLNLLKTESFEQVTVQQICLEAEIGRSTFYHHYVDKFALLEHLNNQYADKFKKIMVTRISTVTQSTSLVTLVSDLLPDKDALLILLNVHVSSLSLDANFRKIINDSLASFLRDHLSTTLPIAYLQNLYVANAMTYITWSLAHGLNEDVAHFMNTTFINIANQITQQNSH
ncbi:MULTISPECIES: TetR/AcrR family transcriptional regulator [Furfurilactobacillus]|uniref:TetR family transcriptional regulator n=1 Tax=Furfurilactobacillus rossiae TaxID=231049 RepID=A0A7C9IZF9_9LACO|nr:TetR/AcrR family transcriptional regulator [Furfurilactobacillus milii]MYV05962.1 TetR family transcriptional regulator [Furfurilactobacillus milii]